MVAIDDINILQTDATIIAGLLILLTLLSFKPSKLEKQPAFVPSYEMTEDERRKKEEEIRVERNYMKITHQGEIVSRNLLAFMTVGGILVFCASATLVIFFGYTLYGKYVMGAGFIFLIIAVILLVTVYRTVTSVSWRGNQLLLRKYYDDLLDRMKVNDEDNESR
jgi:hypothetical protein